ncbi:MAG: UDP-3-O-acyl-N-acetylglucosamine deacetylase [Desulfobacterales bacterium]|nr:UDP-3-O-acyl-N-acetylglucosamine deacetylase [Desulfobacterales bacterium]MCP4160936.1 UDP-3-O-acyl-N-acetylglucosamine deacetylase [Deltaproteobacteria bacterium]
MNNYICQKTIEKAVSCSGTGAHSGKKVNLTLKPAPVNNGIKFVRTDLPNSPEVKGLFNKVVDTSMATVIGHDGVIVSTIEHLMASFAGFGIDNVIVELDNYELPILDGSAELYASILEEAGIKDLETPRCFFVVNEKIELCEGEKKVTVYPSDVYKLTCMIDFSHPMIGRQEIDVEITSENFRKEIASARTFGFFQDLEYLKMYGLARGVTLDSGIAFDNEGGILNESGLRFENECVRHKLLDCLGDFSLIGMPILGHIVTEKSGHDFNYQFIKKFFNQRKAWGTCEVKI